MRSLVFAWRSLSRQPGRAALGILGIAAAGALLFDMLLLSRGLVVSLEDLLDRFGFDIRVTATPAAPLAGPRLTGVREMVASIEDLREVRAAVPSRIAQAETAGPEGRPAALTFLGAGMGAERPWTLLEGRDLDAAEAGGLRPLLMINRRAAEALGLAPGASLALRAACGGGDRSALPPLPFEIAGIAEFPFDDASQYTVAAALGDFERACGGEGSDEADLILVAAADGHDPDAAVDAVLRAWPHVHAFTNEHLVARFQEDQFSYFRQISTVLSTVTLLFGFLLITVLLTVSVNQRIGEVAALRALGLTRGRVMAGVVCESVLMVAIGGLLAVPLGAALASWLDGILRGMPGIPANLRFFAFEPRALVWLGGLLAADAFLAALYPVRLVARLPIAATLREEVT